MGEALYLVSEVLPILRTWGLHRDCLAVIAKLEDGVGDGCPRGGTIPRRYGHPPEALAPERSRSDPQLLGPPQARRRKPRRA